MPSFLLCNFSFVSFSQSQQMRKDVLIQDLSFSSVIQDDGVFSVAKNIDTSDIEIDKSFQSLVKSVCTPRA